MSMSRDLVDGGEEPVYVYTQALKLHANAPSNVFLVKGNHDDFLVNKFFAQHFPGSKGKKVNFHTALDLHLYGDDARNELPASVEKFLAHFQEHFFSTLYVGCSDGDKKINYMQCFHGGLEPGYDPYPFLASDKSFENIAELKRSWFFEKYGDKLQKIWIENDPNHKYGNVFESMKTQYKEQYNKDIRTIDPSYGEYYDDKDFKQMHKAIIGHWWNYFLTEDFPYDAPCYSLCGSQITLNLIFSYEQAKDMLTNRIDDKSQRHSHQIVTMFRGHQHHDFPEVRLGDVSCLLRERLRKRQGWERQWKGLLHTIVNHPRHTGYESFVVVQLAQDPKDWMATQFYKKPAEEVWEKREERVLG